MFFMALCKFIMESMRSSVLIEPVQSHDESSEDTSGEGPPHGVSVSGLHKEASELMHSMSLLLEAQTQMMAMQGSAVAVKNLQCLDLES